MAAMNGLDPAGHPGRGHRDQAAGGRARAGAPAEPAPAAVVPAAEPEPSAHARQRHRHPEHRLAVRRLPLARRGDRVAGERVQQLDGVIRQRARRHAGDARHVELRAEQPRPALARPELRDRQRPRGRDVPQAAAQPDGRRRERGDRGLLPGARARSSTAASSTTRSVTWPTCRRCARASAGRRSGRGQTRSAERRLDRARHAVQPASTAHQIRAGAGRPYIRAHDAPPPDRRLRRRRLLDGAGNRCSTTVLGLAAAAGRAGQGLLPSHRVRRRGPLRRPLLPRTSRRDAASPRTSRSSAATAAPTTSARTCSTRT